MTQLVPLKAWVMIASLKPTRYTPPHYVMDIATDWNNCFSARIFENYPSVSAQATYLNITDPIKNVKNLKQNWLTQNVSVECCPAMELALSVQVSCSKRAHPHQCMRSIAGNACVEEMRSLSVWFLITQVFETLRQNSIPDKNLTRQ